MATATEEEKNDALRRIKECIEGNKEMLIEANRLDKANATKQLDSGSMSSSMFKRLDLESKFGSTLKGIDDVIALHSEATYFAYATGFAPGFCYLGTLPEALQTPRLDTPRATVPSGAVAIADAQTAVYPCESPGGWRLIGACPEPLFNLNDTPPSLLNVGATVRFEPINEAVFRALGGVIP